MNNLKTLVSVRRLMLAPFAATLAAALAASAAGAAEPTRCAGTIAGTADTGALVVPEGETCAIAPRAHVRVSGYVEVKPRATLEIRRGDGGTRGALSVGGDIMAGRDATLRSAGTLSVAGNLTATGSEDVRVYDSATIHGNVTISSWKRQVELDGIVVDGTASIQHSDTGAPFLGGLAVINSHLGELVFKHNDSIVNISHDRIARRLECAPNRYYAFRFVGNTFDGRPLPDSYCGTKR